jgi:hypothetical protein
LQLTEAVAKPRPSVGHAGPTWRQALLSLYLPYLVAVSLTFASTPDDAFVTLRYAANLVHGHGLVFNPGEHVQGFTSPLGLVVAVFAYVLPGGFPLLYLKVASLVFGLLTMREGAKLIYGLGLPDWARVAGSVTLAMCPIIAFASGNGLETSLEMWLLVAIARRLVPGNWQPSNTILAVLAAGAVLTRLDAFVPIFCMAVAGLAIEREVPPVQRASWFLGALVALALTEIGEMVFFGSLLPNTYYAKSIPLARAWHFGLQYLSNLLQPTAFLWGHLNAHGANLFVSAIEAAFLVAGVYAAVRFRPRCGYLMAIILGQTLFILKSGGDWMIGGRFLAPAATAFIVMETVGAVEIAEFFQRRAADAGLSSVRLTIAALLVSTSVIPLAYLHAPLWRFRGIDDHSLIQTGQYGPYSTVWADLPEWLQCVPSDSLVATSEVGYLGFARQNLRLIDLRGLTDRSIAVNAPTLIREPTGISDYTWYESTSFIGGILLNRHPGVIVEFDGHPPSRVLDGQYLLAEVHVVGDLTARIYLPTTSGGLCRT